MDKDKKYKVKNQKYNYLILLFGHNSSGKSTISKEMLKYFELSRVNGDEIREFLKDKINYFKDSNYSYPNEKISKVNILVTQLRIDLIKELINSNQNILIDGSGIKKSARKKFTQLVKDNKKYKTIIIETKISEIELLKRLMKRDLSNSNDKWVYHYEEFRKERYESLSKSEGDFCLEYNQKNLDELILNLKEIINN
ncbi:MAG: nucleoside monophosphate kinase [Nanoarchaeales archaeon]|nr:nucleoside monophosphate kinase [Nanoarchaeales archaeon]